MADSGLASETGPTGRAVPRPSSPPDQPVQPGPRTPGNPAAPDPLTDSLLRDGLVQVSPPEEDSGGGCSDRTGSRSGSVEQACAQVAPHRTSAGPPPYHSVGPRTAVTPHGTAETCTPSHPHQGASGARNGLRVGGGGGGGVCVSIRGPQPASAPAPRSSSEEAQQVEVCGHSPPGGPACHAQKAQGQVEVTCKPSPRRQGCDALAAAYCHEAGCPAQLVQGGPGLLCGPPVGNGSEDCVGVENFHPYHHLHHHHHLHQRPCEEPPRYGSYANHGLLEDGFTCCHPRPLPAPARTPPRPADEEAAGQYRAGAPAHPEGPLLALPRLVASVSETGLDASRMLPCCSLRCPWAGPLPPRAGGCHAWTDERPRSASRPISPVTSGLRTAAATAAGRDASTMTAPREVRDVGVQTGPPAPPHVFPQVCLVEEGGAAAGGPGGAAGLDGKRGSLKSPVKEVKWDAEGMTWEVYGAAVDPEELGLAIQRHLELQIRETASRAAKLSRQDTATSRRSCAGGGKEVGKKRGRVSLGSFRPPACCARTTSAVD